MAKIIVASKYFKSGEKTARQKGYLVNYIATRKNADKVEKDYSKINQSKSQEKLIKQILKDYPEIKESLEYEDYISSPNMKNASSLITKVVDDNIEELSTKKNMVEYIARRPRAERRGDHALVTDEGVPINLSEYSKKIANHEGLVFSHVISLRREDAERLGYNNSKAFENLVKSQLTTIASASKIDIKNLKWCFAFHNESHHPHIHLLIYSKDKKEGYLTEKGIDKIKQGFARQIFRNEQMHLYENKGELRDNIRKLGKEKVQKINKAIQEKTYDNKNIESLLIDLTKHLKAHKGKKVYGFLKTEAKITVDKILEELSEDTDIKELYSEWEKLQEEIIKTYTLKPQEKIPLNQREDFKPIKNEIIKQAELIGSFFSDLEINTENEPREINTKEKDFMLESEDTEEKYSENKFAKEIESEYTKEIESEYTKDKYKKSDFHESESRSFFSKKIDTSKPNINWSENYKLAKKYFYGTKKIKKDYLKAIELLSQETEKNNLLAFYDLGLMFEKGLGTEVNLELSQKYYETAFAGFKTLLESESNKKGYISYRLGKMFLQGLGTEKNEEAAFDCFSEAYKKGNKYAAFSLANMYYYGQFVNIDYEIAFKYFLEAASYTSNGYTNYKVAEMYETGTGTTKNEELSEEHYKIAFNAFNQLLTENEDDKILNRVGQMCMFGKGTKKDFLKAEELFKKSIELKNENAAYNLTSLYLNKEFTKEKTVSEKQDLIESAIKILKELNTEGKDYIKYKLASIYLDKEFVENKSDTKKLEFFEEGVKLLKECILNNHEPSKYKLASFYLSEENIKSKRKEVWLSDQNEAIKLLKELVENKNTFAMLKLGTFYFYNQISESDIEKAIEYLNMAKELGNEYAEEILKKIELYQKIGFNNNISNIFKHLGRLLEDDYNFMYGVYSPKVDRKTLRKQMEKKLAQGLKI